MGERIAVFRKEHFNAAHRLYCPEWSEAQNEAVFGKCNNHNYHGHNYDLEIKVVGVIDPVTGYMIDMKYLSDLVKDHVISQLDHKNLNLDVPEFKTVNPTAENIAIYIFRKLRPILDSKYDIQIRLYETERNFVEYPAAL